MTLQEIDAKIKDLIRERNSFLDFKTTEMMKARKEFLNEQRKKLTEYLGTYPPFVLEIILSVCAEFDVVIAEIFNNTRKHHIVFPRQVAMFLIVKKISVTETADVFGKDFGTVQHAIKVVKARMETDAKIREKVTRLMTV